MGCTDRRGATLTISVEMMAGACIDCRISVTAIRNVPVSPHRCGPVLIVWVGLVVASEEWC